MSSGKADKDRIEQLERENKELRRLHGDGAGSPLSRSSIEAYAGIALAIVLAVLPMTWWLRAALFIVLAVVVGHFLWRAPLAYRLPKSVRSIVIVLTVGWLVWVGQKNVIDARNIALFPPGVPYIRNWGPLVSTRKITTDNDGRKELEGSGSKIIVDGSKAEQLSDGYRLWGAVMFWDGTIDPMDVRSISKSSLFDITPDEMTIIIPWSREFTDIYLQPQRPISASYVLIALPKSVGLDKVAAFKNVRDALDAGGVILQKAAGPV